MTWQVRHEGSPNATPNLTGQQVLQGVAEGVWEPSDEVRGPGDTAWRSIESHPYFEEAVQEIEPPPAQHHPDESHLDMNPLIDVALVLLIFFIITASYSALKKVIPMPTMSKKGGGTPRVVANNAPELIKVTARTGADGKVVYTVDGREVPEDLMWQQMAVGVAEKRNTLLIDVENVRWDSVVRILDAAKQARVDKHLMRVKE
jgi:biopolymer transport protein ExbD